MLRQDRPHIWATVGSQLDTGSMNTLRYLRNGALRLGRGRNLVWRTKAKAGEAAPATLPQMVVASVLIIEKEGVREDLPPLRYRSNTVALP